MFRIHIYIYTYIYIYLFYLVTFTIHVHLYSFEVLLSSVYPYIHFCLSLIYICIVSYVDTYI